MKQGSCFPDHNGTARKLCTLTLCLLTAVCLLQGAGAAPDVTYPESGETITTTATITFDYSTDSVASAATGNVWISTNKGGQENVVVQGVDLIAACGFPEFANWVLQSDGDLTEELGGTKRYENAYAFYAEGEYHVIIWNYDAAPTAYTWNGSAWVLDTDWSDGLSKHHGGGSAWVMGGETYLLRETDGFKYNNVTNQWDSYPAIAAGLTGSPTYYSQSDFVFYDNGYWRNIQTITRYNSTTWYIPYLNSYTWNGSAWVDDDYYIEDFNALQCNGCGAYSKGLLSAAIFSKGGELYNLQPTWSGNRALPMGTGTVSSFKWSGTAWEPDYDLNAGLASAEDANSWSVQYLSFNGADTILEFGYIDQANDAVQMDRYAQLEGYYNTTTARECSATLFVELYDTGNYYVDVTTSATTGEGTETGSDSSLNFFTISHAGVGDTPTQPAGTTNKTGIYITAADWSTGSVSGTTASDYSGFLHNWRSFAAGSAGGYMGRILVDGAITTTCNYTWDCMTDLNVGSHTYALYSTNGGYQYTGTFNIDANTSLIKLYVPITYNVFKLWETSQEQTALTCSDIYSLTAGGEVSTNKRISAGLYIGTSYLYWNSTNIAPQNCYSSLNIAAQYPYALPGQTGSIEPAVFMYSGINGIAEGELFGWHFLNGGIVGTRNRNGYTNFYDLHALAEYYAGSGGIFSGRVERRLASSQDGYYSPIVSIAAPNMNVDSALYGDANYNPGDFALNDSITCEASLLSGGYVVYDVNILLISDQNAIYDSYNFTPFQKYNAYMDAEQDNGAFNIVWHTFENVNIGHTGTVQCAIQASNELGYKSGWVLSAPRTMYSSNLTAAGGMNIFVQYEDGTTSYLGHQSAYDADLNYIDIYNWYHQPYYWSYDTSENPLTLFEGDGVIAQTWDRNAGRAASKSFDIDRGDAFDITLYLADKTASDHAPVTFATQMYEQSAYGDRVYCKTSFYDKDLDWNSTRFMFWTSNEGSINNPLCEQTIGYAYTTNCNPTDSPCLTPGASESLMSECGSANDCYVQAYFSKRGCTSLAAGEVTGYCAMRVFDNNGNSVLAQASTQLTVPTYQLWALCEAYTLIGSEKESVIYTGSEKGYIECLVGLDNVSQPSDLNWSVEFEGKQLTLEETQHDDYMDQDYFKFRAEATAEIEALARLRSTDGETWEGDGTVFVLHPVYGSEDATVHIAVTFLGSRTGDGGASEYSEAQFDELWNWINGFAIALMTDPIGTVQARFFEVLVITVFIVIFVPLFLVAMAIKAKQKNGG